MAKRKKKSLATHKRKKRKRQDLLKRENIGGKDERNKS